jgi:hypothetical protein
MFANVTQQAPHGILGAESRRPEDFSVAVRALRVDSLANAPTP